MIKIAIKSVWFADNVRAGGEFGKSLSTNQARGVVLWYLGNGVLIEARGQPDVLVPISSVRSVEADGSVSAAQWAGEAEVRAQAKTPYPGDAPMYADKEPVRAMDVSPVFKRGPGRPPKVQP